MTHDLLYSATLAETQVLVKTPRRVVSSRAFWRNRLVAAVTGLAVMIMGAVPAHADRNDDLAKTLAAIAVIGIIAHETAKDKKHPKPVPEPVGRGRVPEVCAIDITSGGTEVTVYAERCMRDEGFSYRLPQQCAGTIRIYGERDRIYSAQCLRDAGFRIGGRRGN